MKRPLAKHTPLSWFMRHASEDHKREVYLGVLAEAQAKQDKVRQDAVDILKSRKGP